MSLDIKVFLETAGTGIVDIKRFPICTSDGDFYKHVRDKITRLYPGLVATRFTLYWKDADGDLISFRCNEEMADALTYVHDGVFRVYVFANTETSDKPEASYSGSQVGHYEQCSVQPQPPQPHSGHRDNPLYKMCRACHSPVSNDLYKCVTCPDFYLCQSCVARGIHHEHQMLKMDHNLHWTTKPSSSGVSGSNQKEQIKDQGLKNAKHPDVKRKSEHARSASRDGKNDEKRRKQDYPERDTKLQDCLLYFMKLGFSDSNGWLSELIVANHFNMNATMNAIIARSASIYKK